MFFIFERFYRRFNLDSPDVKNNYTMGNACGRLADDNVVYLKPRETLFFELSYVEGVCSPSREIPVWHVGFNTTDKCNNDYRIEYDDIRRIRDITLTSFSIGDTVIYGTKELIQRMLWSILCMQEKVNNRNAHYYSSYVPPNDVDCVPTNLHKVFISGTICQIKEVLVSTKNILCNSYEVSIIRKSHHMEISNTKSYFLTKEEAQQIHNYFYSYKDRKPDEIYMQLSKSGILMIDLPEKIYTIPMNQIISISYNEKDDLIHVYINRNDGSHEYFNTNKSHKKIITRLCKLMLKYTK